MKKRAISSLLAMDSVNAKSIACLIHDFLFVERKKTQ